MLSSFRPQTMQSHSSTRRQALDVGGSGRSCAQLAGKTGAYRNPKEIPKIFRDLGNKTGSWRRIIRARESPFSHPPAKNNAQRATLDACEWVCHARCGSMHICAVLDKPRVAGSVCSRAMAHNAARRAGLDEWHASAAHRAFLDSSRRQSHRADCK